MRKQLSRIIFILIISLFIHPLISYSQEGPSEEDIQLRREPLKGINGVFVMIEDLPPVAKELGITKESLKTEVELKLRLAGIRVYSKEEALENLSPTLYVNFNTVENIIGGIKFYPFSISVEIVEPAQIRRNAYTTTVITWRKGAVGGSKEENLIMQMRKALKIVTDPFLNDYLAVNPKK